MFLIRFFLEGCEVWLFGFLGGLFFIGVGEEGKYSMNHTPSYRKKINKKEIGIKKFK